MGKGKGGEVKIAFVDPTFRVLALERLKEGGDEAAKEEVLMEVKMAMVCPVEAFEGEGGEGGGEPFPRINSKERLGKI